MFDYNSAPQSSESFRAPPAGVYKVIISKIELRNNKKSRGNHFAFMVNIVEPVEYDTYQMVLRFNFESESKTAKEIGHAQLADVLYAIQVRGFRDEQELTKLAEGKEFLLETQNEESDDGSLWPSMVSAWSRGGKHRNEARSLQKIDMGPTGRPNKRSKKAAQTQNSFDGRDVPF